jgi:hypothetical protein
MVGVVIVSPLRASDSYLWSPRTSLRWAIAVLDSGKAAVVMGLTTNPAMVAAGSWRPSRSKKGDEDSQGVAHQVGVASAVEIADGQSEVIERGRRVAVSACWRARMRARCDSVKWSPLS